MSLPNGISLCPTALAGSRSVTDDIQMDIRTEHAMVMAVTTGGIA